MQPGATKRQKETSRLEHRKEKEARKEERKKSQGDKPKRDPNAPDPDIAGIVPGPQPLPEGF